MRRGRGRPSWAETPVGGAADFLPRFDGPDGLVTNESSFWLPSLRGAPRSPDWEQTSGSFFIRGGAGWTGEPDDRPPGARSERGNNSALFRLASRRGDFGDVSLSCLLMTRGLVSSPA